MPGGAAIDRDESFSAAPLGQDWTRDTEIFGTGRAREDWPNVALSHTGRWLVVEVSQGWVRSEVYLLDRSHPERGFNPVHAGVDAVASTTFAGDRLFVHTNQDAPNYALYEVDPERVERANWRLVLPERQDRVLDGVSAVGGRLAAHEMQDAHPHPRRPRGAQEVRIGRILG